METGRRQRSFTSLVHTDGAGLEGRVAGAGDIQLLIWMSPEALIPFREFEEALSRTIIHKTNLDAQQ